MDSTDTTEVVRHTLGGRVRDQKVDGVDHHAGDDFTYDAAGRLTAAWTPGHSYTYGFSNSGNCENSHTADASIGAVPGERLTVSGCWTGANRVKECWTGHIVVLGTWVYPIT